ncbi:MAG: hypothetical protein WBB76_01510 [Gaiellaceae bacterium]
MRRLVAAAAFGTVLATLGFVGARLVEPGRRGLELDIYVLVVGALAVLTAVMAAREAFPISEGSALAAALETEPQPPVRPPDLERTERLLTLATGTSFDLHYRLRPVLREVAEQRLAERRGLRLDGGDTRVQATLGDDLWEVVRPDREPPARRFAAGLDPSVLRGLVERLESIR